MMWQPQLNDRVRLLHDVPDLLLHSGDVGVVKSVWFAPQTAYEVEFEQPKSAYRVRKILQPAEVEPDAAPRQQN